MNDDDIEICDDCGHECHRDDFVICEKCYKILCKDCAYENEAGEYECELCFFSYPND